MRRPIQFMIGLSLVIIAAASVAWPLSGTKARQAVTVGPSPVGLTAMVAGGSYKQGSYDEYLSGVTASAERPGIEVRVEGESYTRVEGMDAAAAEDEEGRPGAAVWTDETGTVTWEFDVPQTGLYNLQFKYFVPEGKESDVERELRIDGELPFAEARSIVFHRVWKNETNAFERDEQGNDLMPAQVEVRMWQETVLKDTTGYYTEPYLFYFTEGKHALSLTSVKEPLTIDYFELLNVPEEPAYAEVKAEYEAKGYRNAGSVSIKIQGEHTAHKSSPTLLPYNDRSDPAVEPFHVSKVRNNAMGGWGWRLPGQRIEWEFEAPEDGLYTIALKFRQNYLRGGYAVRSLTIDGKLPFREAGRIAFPYSSDWQMGVLGSDEEPYRFYLTKGTHTIGLETTLGDMAAVIRAIETTILNLNAMYREIISYTGTVPDSFRDYQLDRRIPHMIDVFRRESANLYAVADLIEGAGDGTDRTATIKSLAYQLKDMAERPDTVPSRIDRFKTNVGGLGDWLNSFKEQPLAIDYLLVTSPGEKLPQPESSFFRSAASGVRSFLASFTEDYDEYGAEDDQAISVWLTTARDQAQVLKRLIDDSFTKETGIKVSLKLVNPDVVLSATIAGKGPDIALQLSNEQPVNYATRNALQPLSDFPDFAEVAARFHDSALVPYEFGGRYYALPEQQTFPVMFYRKDIMDELKLEIPQTWDDVYEMIPTLQKQNLIFGLPGSETATQTPSSTLMPSSALTMMLYQRDGTLYTDNGMKSNLDSKAGIEAFTAWTDLFVSYKLPIQIDFANRFRTGEMPIGIADYTMYNMLSVFAPELKGLWEFVPVPGMPAENGQIRRDVGSNGTGAVMFKSAKDKEAAWSFLKWWTSKETQLAFGRQMEIRLGTSARYPTANLEALSLLPWPSQDYRRLMEQFEWVHGNPEVPGGYMTGRHVDNAFRKVVVQGDDPREAMEYYVRYMNEEITLKRKEFNLPYEE